MGWFSVDKPHVYPLDDLLPHTEHDCLCMPVLRNGVVVHNAWDRREKTEPRRIPYDQLLATDVYWLVINEQITTSRAAELLGLSVWQVRKTLNQLMAAVDATD